MVIPCQLIPRILTLRLPKFFHDFIIINLKIYKIRIDIILSLPTPSCASRQEPIVFIIKSIMRAFQFYDYWPVCRI